MEKRFKKIKGHEMGKINNFKELLNRAEEKFGEKIAFKYKDDYAKKNYKYITHTFKDYKLDVTAIGTALINMGLEGKRVALIGNNSYEWCTSYMATTAGNMTIVPLDKALTEIEIISLIQRSKADIAIFDEKYLETFKKIINERSSNLSKLVCFSDVGEDAIYYKDLLEEGLKLIESGNTSFEKATIKEDEMTIMLFTSGTTAAAKAVMLSQQNVCSNINALPRFVLINEDDVLLSFLPIHHTFESTITFLYGCLYSGATMAFCDGLKYISDNLKEYGITVFVTVPLMLETMYKKIMKGIESQGKTKLINIMVKVSKTLLIFGIDIRKKVFKPILNQLGGKLRLVLHGGAPIEKSISIGLTNFGINMVQGYGLTETSPVISAENDKYKKPGSTGLVLVNEQVKIVDKNDEGIGEVIVKGPNVMMGYYENEEETNKVLKDGWFYTGDLGYLDKDGFLYLTGRKKDVIVLKNGKNIYPQEIEFLIGKFPYVQECMVYGMPTKNNDLSISAKIVYSKEALETIAPNLTEEGHKDYIWQDIKTNINIQIPDYKHIKSIQVTTEPMVKTTTQKIKRAVELNKILA